MTLGILGAEPETILDVRTSKPGFLLHSLIESNRGPEASVLTAFCKNTWH